MIIPVWMRAAAAGAVLLVILMFMWIYYPGPRPSPAEDALRQQIEELQKKNEALEKEAATRTAEAQQFREDANAETDKIPEIRSRRRTARADGQRRATTILEATDERVADILRDQHARTRRQLESLRPAGAGTEGNGGTDPHR